MAELTCLAARWACLALAADEVQELVESGTVCALVQDRIHLSIGFSAKMTKLQFRSWLSVDWQRHNARIVSEWSRLVRQKL